MPVCRVILAWGLYDWFDEKKALNDSGTCGNIRDMPFSEKTKKKVKERAHYWCCLCHKCWVAHIHHIVPEAENGPDTEENAAPLCANCHDLYGGNPDKRKFIKESRDFWYDLCDRESPPDSQLIREMRDNIRKFVTKKDLQKAVSFLDDRMQNIMRQPLSTSTQAQQISDITAAFSDAVFGPPFAICPECECRYDIEASKCLNCGWPEELGLH